MEPDNVKNLYEALKNEYNLGTEDDFRKNMEDPTKRKNLYDAVKDEYDLGTPEQYEEAMGMDPASEAFRSWGVGRNLGDNNENLPKEAPPVQEPQSAQPLKPQAQPKPKAEPKPQTPEIKFDDNTQRSLLQGYFNDALNKGGATPASRFVSENQAALISKAEKEDPSLLDDPDRLNEWMQLQGDKASVTISSDTAQALAEMITKKMPDKVATDDIPHQLQEVLSNRDVMNQIEEAGRAIGQYAGEWGNDVYKGTYSNIMGYVIPALQRQLKVKYNGYDLNPNEIRNFRIYDKALDSVNRKEARQDIDAVVNPIFSKLNETFDAYEKSLLPSYDRPYFGGVNYGGNSGMNAAQLEQQRPDKLWQALSSQGNLQKIMDTFLTFDKNGKATATQFTLDRAKKMGVSPEVYLGKYVEPQLENRIYEFFNSKMSDQYAVKNYADYFIRKMQDSLLGQAVTYAVGGGYKPKSEGVGNATSYMQQETQKTEQGLGSKYNTTTLGNVVGTVGQFAVDTPAIGAAGKVAGKVLSQVAKRTGNRFLAKALEEPTGSFLRITDPFEKEIASKASLMTSSGGMALFNGTNAALNALNNGERGWDVAQAAASSAASGAAMGAVFHVASPAVAKVMQPLKEKTAFAATDALGTKVKQITKRFGVGALEAATNIGVFSTYDAAVATLSNENFSFTDNLPNAVGMWLGGKASVGGVKKGISDLRDMLRPGVRKPFEINFTEENKDEIRDALGGKSLLDINENDLETIMNDTKNVSLETRNKVAAVTAHTLDPHLPRTYKYDVKGTNEKGYVLETTEDGTLISRHKYNSNEQLHKLKSDIESRKTSYDLMEKQGAFVMYATSDQAVQGDFSQEAFDAASKFGYKGTNDSDDMKVLKDLQTPGTDVNNEYMKNVVVKVGNDVAENNSLSLDDLTKIVQKKAEDWTPAERTIMQQLSDAYENYIPKDGKLSTEREKVSGAGLADRAGAGTVDENPQAVAQMSTEISQKVEDAKKAWDDYSKTEDGENVIGQMNAYAQQGVDPMSDEMYNYLSQNFTEEQLAPLANLLNAQARQRAFLDKTSANIDEQVSQVAQNVVFHGSLKATEGAELPENSVVYVSDGQYNYVLTGGDVKINEDGKLVSTGEGPDTITLRRVDENGILVDGEGVYIRKPEDMFFTRSESVNDLSDRLREQIGTNTTASIAAGAQGVTPAEGENGTEGQPEGQNGPTEPKTPVTPPTQGPNPPVEGPTTPEVSDLTKNIESTLKDWSQQVGKVDKDIENGTFNTDNIEQSRKDRKDYIENIEKQIETLPEGSDERENAIRTLVGLKKIDELLTKREDKALGPQIPRDEHGNGLYHQMEPTVDNINAAIDDIQKRPDLSSLGIKGNNDPDAFADRQIKKADKELSDLEGQYKDAIDKVKNGDVDDDTINDATEFAERKQNGTLSDFNPTTDYGKYLKDRADAQSRKDFYNGLKAQMIKRKADELSKDPLAAISKVVSTLPDDFRGKKQLNHSVKAIQELGENPDPLKVLSEVNTMEQNLSKMEDFEGREQVTKAIGNIKAKFAKDGYEIVSLVGRDYNEGMKVTANFTSNDSLGVGEQKIISERQPQINKDGKMVQAADIMVAQGPSVEEAIEAVKNGDDAMWDKLQEYYDKEKALGDPDEADELENIRQVLNESKKGIKERYKNTNSNDLLVSLSTKKGKIYNETVSEITDRIYSGRASLRGQDSLGGNETASSVLAAAEIIAYDKRGTEGSEGENKDVASIRANQEQGIESWAKDNGKWLDEDAIREGSVDKKVYGKGGENIVYQKDDNTVVKLWDPYYYSKDKDLLDKLRDVSVFNNLFPDTAYNVIGYTRTKDGKFRVVMEQKLIQGKEYTKDEYLADKEAQDKVRRLFEDMGLKDVDGDGLVFANDKYYVSDVHNGNIIFDKDGNPHIIDANAKLNEKYAKKLFGDGLEVESGPAEKFETAKKIIGAKGTITLQDGSVISGTYVAVPAMSITPSHDPFNEYKKSKGFPQTEDGKSMNSRDYEHNKAYQDVTNDMGRNLDGQMIDDVPIISHEGIPYSGNGRGMARQLAAKNGTDGKYMEAFKDNAERFGMKADELDKLDHATLAFVPDKDLPYTVEVFDKFNKPRGKGENNEDTAIINARKLTDEQKNSIADKVTEYGSLESLYKSEKGVNELLKKMKELGLVSDMEITSFRDNGKLNEKGKKFIENVLTGTMFDADTVHLLFDYPELKRKLIQAMQPILENRKLGEYSAEEYINEAVKLAYEASKKGLKVDDYLKSGDFFEGKAADKYSPLAQLIGRAMDGNVDEVKELIKKYNLEAKQIASDEMDAFGKPTKEEFIKQFVDLMNKKKGIGTGSNPPKNNPPKNNTPANGGENGVDNGGENGGEGTARPELGEKPLSVEEIEGSSAGTNAKAAAKQFLDGSQKGPMYKFNYDRIYKELRGHKPGEKTTEPNKPKAEGEKPKGEKPSKPTEPSKPSKPKGEGEKPKTPKPEGGKTEEKPTTPKAPEGEKDSVQAHKDRVKDILAQIKAAGKKGKKDDGKNAYSLDTLNDEQQELFGQLFEALGDTGFDKTKEAKSVDDWKKAMTEDFGDALKQTLGWTDKDVDELFDDVLGMNHREGDKEQSINEWLKENNNEGNESNVDTADGHTDLSGGGVAGNPDQGVQGGTENNGGKNVEGTDKPSGEQGTGEQSGEDTEVGAADNGGNEGADKPMGGASSGSTGRPSNGGKSGGRGQGGQVPNGTGGKGSSVKSDGVRPTGGNNEGNSGANAKPSVGQPKRIVNLSNEKTPYKAASDPEGTHTIGSVVPTSAVDAMKNAFAQIEKERKQSIRDFVRDELGYSSDEEMMSDPENGKDMGLAGEQVDGVALAINSMKHGKSFIIGDMTGVGKGRQAAALIRWGLKNKKKVIFFTDTANLFSDMYRDLTDIGNADVMPLLLSTNGDANITNSDKEVIVRKPSSKVLNQMYEDAANSGNYELPKVLRGKGKGRQYEFIMTNYSQFNKDPDAKGNQRKYDFLRNYAKDAIIIMDESHNAAGDSQTGKFMQELVKNAGGVTFLSATYAKRPDNMMLYALRSSLGAANMSEEAMLAAIKNYGVPMQEIMASALFGSGEMIRRERDFSDVKTHWLKPNEVYTEQESVKGRKTADKTIDFVNDIIDFQQNYVTPIIRQMEQDLQSSLGSMAVINPEHFRNTGYSGQVSNVTNLLTYALKAKKAAEMAIQQIKEGKRPVIAVDNTMESYLKQLGEHTDNADFGEILAKGIKFALRYKHTYGDPSDKEHYHEAVLDAEDLLGADGAAELARLRNRIKTYRNDKEIEQLFLSPIDMIESMIEEAGYHCGEITGRTLKLEKSEGGGYDIVSRKANKKEEAIKFNGGTTDKPLDPKDQYDALVLNTSGATGISLHSSKKFGNQSQRTMIILQAAKDVNDEVQIRGRIDRTGQVHRGEYYYVVSPVPAEQKLFNTLKAKLASLDANAVGDQDVKQNKVEAVDMDNKYGDQIALDFLQENQDINNMLGNKGISFNRVTGQWKGRDGLLYDVMVGMQRLSCDDQERILNELTSRYVDTIAYLDENGINDLKTATQNLEAVTIDKAPFVKGTDNDSPNEFAHDTNIERVEVNLLRKPLHASDIKKEIDKRKEVETATDGSVRELSDSEIYDKHVTDGIRDMLAEKQAKTDKAVEKIKDKVRKDDPREKHPELTDEEYEDLIDKNPKVGAVRVKYNEAYRKLSERLNSDADKVAYAFNYLKPGHVVLVPITDKVGDDAPHNYGIFIGFDFKGKDPRNVQAVFAVKDSRGKISVPISSKYDVIKDITNVSSSDYDISDKNTVYTTQEERNAWWDKMIPKNTSRTIRYMITGNILQACGTLGKHKGQIVTFTRKDPKTGEVSVDRGMLLAEDFDPEDFKVRSKVTKDEVWSNSRGFTDDVSNISVYRSGNEMIVQFKRRGKEPLKKHPINNDEEWKKLLSGDMYSYGVGKDAEIDANIPEKNVEAALEHLFKKFGFTKEEMLIMPDSTEKVDRIVKTNKPYKEVIDELGKKYGVQSKWDADYEIRKAMKKYKLDVNNEELKTKIRELVQLRQAYLRKSYEKEPNDRLGWDYIIERQRQDKADNKDNRQEHYAKAEAIAEEMEFRGMKGTEYHFKKGEWSQEDAVKTFNELNKDKVNTEIMDKVLKAVGKLNLRFVLSDKIDNATGGQQGGDTVEYNYEFMNSPYIPDDLKANTILHEMIHSATSYAIDLVEHDEDQLLSQEMVDAVNELKAIQEAVEKDPVFTHEPGWKQYGVSRNMWGKLLVHELVAEAGSNPSFREDLKKANLWERMKGAFLQFFGLDYFGGKSPNGSAYKKGDTYKEVMDRLDILLTNFNESAWRQYQRAYWRRSSRSKSINSSEQKYIEDTNMNTDLVNSEGTARADVICKVGEMRSKFNMNDKELHTEYIPESMPENIRKAYDRGEDVKGWYDPKDGSVHLYMPNIHDAYTAEKTILHEVVGHKGLRELLGDKGYAAFMRKLYIDNVGGVADYVKENAYKYGYDLYKTIDEYLAEEAEKFGGDDRSLMQRAWDKVTDLLNTGLNKLGFNTKLTERDVRRVLWESKNRIKEGDPEDSIKRNAFLDRLSKTDVSATSFEGKTYDESIKRDVNGYLSPEAMMRVADTDVHEDDTMPEQSAKEYYHHALSRMGYVWSEAHSDRMQALRELMKAYTHGKADDVPGFENPIWAENRASSKLSMQVENFKRNYAKPLEKVVAVAMKAFPASGSHKNLQRRRALQIYLLKKSGLEKNRVYFVRDFLNKEKAKNITENDLLTSEKAEFDKRMAQNKTDLANGNIDQSQYDFRANMTAKAVRREAMNQLQNEFDAKRAKLKRKFVDGGKRRYDEFYKGLDEWINLNIDLYDAGENDYCGFREMEGKDFNDNYDDAAEIAEVMSTESQMENHEEGIVDDLWEQINKVAKFSLDTEYNAGLIPKGVYDSTTTMLDWYVPHRGFDQEVAEDHIDYFDGNGKAFSGPALMKAVGRYSSADLEGPLAYLCSQASTSMQRAVKNEVMQTFGRFIDNHYEKDNPDRLVTKTDTWIVRKMVGGQEVWEEEFPPVDDNTPTDQIPSVISNWEAQMKALAKNGNAYRSKNFPHFPFKFRKRTDKDSHTVVVYNNGVKETYVIQGHPRAAQALNGETKDDKPNNMIIRAVNDLTNYWKRLVTTFSPDFIGSNLSRDADQGGSYLLAKESLNYYRKYVGAWWKLFGGKMTFNVFQRKYKNGTLDMSNNDERLYKEFCDNGGMTGFYQAQTLDDWKKEINDQLDLLTGKRGAVLRVMKMINPISFLSKGVDVINRNIENTARFATYKVSREMGRSVAKSILDAKNVSTNFNKQGSYGKAANFDPHATGVRKLNQQLAGGTAQTFRLLIPFYNAGIQSLKLLANNLKEHPVKTIGTTIGGHFAIALAMPFINGMLQSLLDDNDDKRRVVTFDDDGNVHEEYVKVDHYAELPDYVRRQNFCFYVGNGRFITFPIGIENRAFYGMGDLAAGVISQLSNGKYYGGYNDPTEDKILSSMGLISQTLPTDFVGASSGAGLESTFMPAILQPIYEVKVNKDWLGRPVKQDRRGDNDNRPNWQLANRDTNGAFIDLAKYMTKRANPYNDENLRSEAWYGDPDPAAWQHLLKGWSGGFGQTISEIAGLCDEIAALPENEKTSQKISDVAFSNNMPILRRFNKKDPYGETRQKYYNYMRVVSNAQATIKELVEKGETDPIAKMQSVSAEEGRKGKMVQVWAAYSGYIKDLSKQINASNDPQLRKQLMDQRDQIMYMAVHALDNIK